MKKILILISAVLLSISAKANGVEVMGIYYILDNSNYTASVTYTGDNYVDNTYSGGVDIPEGFYYDGLWYDVTSIGDDAFSCCSGLISIDIPSSVTNIGSYAFSCCSGLISIDIPSSVTSIGVEAFGNCSSLTSIDIPNSVTSISNGAFGGCYNLKTMIIPEGVTSIGNGAYYGCSTLTSIDIPSSVTSIGDGAFSGCFILTTIDIPNSVTSIGDEAFFSCGMTSIEIPNSVTSIGTQVFAYCSNLTSIVVEQGNAIYDSRNDCNAIIETASNTLISGCQNTLIPNSVTSIGSYAFNGCSSLTSIDIPSSVTHIGHDAFSGCSGLTSIDIPSSVTSIGDWAFSHCSGLTSITIPYSVTSIGDGAYEGCSGLTAITSLATTPPVLGAAVFDGVPRTIPLYVPAASISLYQAAEQWNEFDIQPYFIEIDPITPSTTELTWEPVDSASLYQLRIYTDSTSSVALDTTLLINADSLNGGIMLQNGTLVARRVKKIIQDAGGTIIVITIDPTSGTSEENPYKVTVSTVSGDRIDVHFDMTVFHGTEILREESGTFVLNEPVVPTGVENLLAPSLPTGIYDLYGHRYPVDRWSSLPAGVYVVRTEGKVEKVMRK